MNFVQMLIDAFRPVGLRDAGPTPANLRAEAVVERRRANWDDTPSTARFTRQQARRRALKAAKRLVAEQNAEAIKARRNRRVSA